MKIAVLKIQIVLLKLNQKIMKRSILCVSLFVTTATLWAQQQKSKTKTTTPATKTVTTVKNTAADPGLKTPADSMSYILGEVAAFGMINQGFGDVKINTSVFMKAFNDIIGKKSTQIDDVTANAMLNNFLVKKQQDDIKAQQAKSQPNIDAGAKFLAENKQKPGVKTTASGLQYEVLRDSTGIKPGAADTVVCNYKGSLLNGTVFDESYSKGQPVTFPLNRVITGWTEGLQLMSTGSKYKFYLPYNLGYGVPDHGPIPGGSTLVFEIELLQVKKPKN